MCVISFKMLRFVQVYIDDLVALQSLDFFFGFLYSYSLALIVCVDCWVSPVEVFVFCSAIEIEVSTHTHTKERCLCARLVLVCALTMLLHCFTAQNLIQSLFSFSHFFPIRSVHSLAHHSVDWWNSQRPAI